MGCLLGCFGHRKNSRRQRRRESFQPRLNRIPEGSIKDVRVPTVEEEEVPKYAKDYSFVEEEEVPKISKLSHHLSVVEEVSQISELSHHLSVVEQVPKISELSHDLSVVEQVPKISELSHLLNVKEVPKTNVVPTTDICDRSEEKIHSPSPSKNRKRVTFDSNIKTYEHIEVEESIELVQEKKQEIKSLEQKQGQCSSSEGSDITSNSSGSYPLNHRYQNCRESDDDDEDEEVLTDCSDESDLDDDYDDDEGYEDQDVYTEEIADNVKDIERLEEDNTKVLSNVRARDRTGYVNAVLKPIENLNQWKAVKSKGRRTQTSNENMIHASFSLEPHGDETKKQRNQEEVAVDASLSTWLTTSSQTTTIGCNSVETAMSDKTLSLNGHYK